MRILVVEDDAKIASFVIKGLEQSGFAVDHASNGEDGLFLAQTEPYDAAIIDVMLPGLGWPVHHSRNEKIEDRHARDYPQR